MHRVDLNYSLWRRRLVHPEAHFVSPCFQLRRRIEFLVHLRLPVYVFPIPPRQAGPNSRAWISAKPGIPERAHRYRYHQPERQDSPPGRQAAFALFGLPTRRQEHVVKAADVDQDPKG